MFLCHLLKNKGNAAWAPSIFKWYYLMLDLKSRQIIWCLSKDVCNYLSVLWEVILLIFHSDLLLWLKHGSNNISTLPWKIKNAVYHMQLRCPTKHQIQIKLKGTYQFHMTTHTNHSYIALGRLINTLISFTHCHSALTMQGWIYVEGGIEDRVVVCEHKRVKKFLHQHTVNLCVLIRDWWILLGLVA